MPIDHILGQPSRRSYSIAIPAVPIAFVVSAVTPIVARQYAPPVLTVCVVVILAIIVRFTPYLLMACGCFFGLSQLAFPDELTVLAFRFHALWLMLAIFCLWRTWRLWPSDLPKA